MPRSEGSPSLHIPRWLWHSPLRLMDGVATVLEPFPELVAASVHQVVYGDHAVHTEDSGIQLLQQDGAASGAGCVGDQGAKIFEVHGRVAGGIDRDGPESPGCFRREPAMAGLRVCGTSQQSLEGRPEHDFRCGPGSLPGRVHRAGRERLSRIRPGAGRRSFVRPLAANRTEYDQCRQRRSPHGRSPPHPVDPSWTGSQSLSVHADL